MSCFLQSEHVQTLGQKFTASGGPRKASRQHGTGPGTRNTGLTGWYAEAPGAEEVKPDPQPKDATSNGLTPPRFSFWNYTTQLRHSRKFTPYEYISANPTSMSIFEYWAVKSSKLMKSLQPRRCRRERHLPPNPRRLVFQWEWIQWTLLEELEQPETRHVERASSRPGDVEAGRNGAASNGSSWRWGGKMTSRTWTHAEVTMVSKS